MSSPAPKVPSFQAQVSICNLGAIREAELNLRPLTVLFGHNGVNKTWAAYSIVQAMSGYPARPNAFSSALQVQLDECCRKTAEAVVEVRRLVDGGHRMPQFKEGQVQPRRRRVPMDLDELLHDLRQELVWNAGVHDIARSLGLPDTQFQDACVEISGVGVTGVDESFRGLSVEVLPAIDRLLADWQLTGDWHDGEPLASLRREQRTLLESINGFALEVTRDKASFISAIPENDWDSSNLETELVSELIGAANRGWVSVNRPFFLPAERKAIAVFVHHLDAATELQSRLGSNDIRLSDGRDLATTIGVGRVLGLLKNATRFPQPVHELIRWLARVSFRSTHTAVSGKARVGALPAIGRQMTEILKGQVTFGDLSAGAAATGGGAAPLVFRFGDGQELPFQSAASLARSLGLIDIWLREEAQPGDLVVIDEPEMNAHPEAQVKIAEMLAMMINAGLRVIITTHSPYLVEHLEGLMLGTRLKPEVRAQFVSRLGLKSDAAFLDPEDLAVYHFEEQADGEVKVFDVLDREECAIDWMTFSRPIAKIGNLINNIMAELGRADESP